MADFMPGYEASAWYGLAVPSKTPVDIVEKLNNEISVGLASAALKARLADLGGTPLPGSPTDFGKLIAAETAKWAAIVKSSGTKPD
jgi:tripartite-type tricarboxylate transporter receptor subunit TctC